MEEEKIIIDTKGSSISKQSSLNTLWNIQNNTLQEAVKVSSLYKTTHGMFAGVPLLCKVDKCPYKNVCIIDVSNRILGQRCIMEAGAIMARFEMWCAHFGIDLSQGKVKDSDLVDASLIRDLVDNEIQILRAENRVAISGDFIGKVVASVDSDGKAYYVDQITPEAQFKLQLQEKRYKILNLLNSTRKDKANEFKKDNHPSVKAAGLIKKLNDLMSEDLSNSVIEAEFKEEEVKREE